jgi:hypothetical protein
MKNPFLRTQISKFIVIAGLAFAPSARAVDPPPDGGYPNKNTAEGQDALFSLTAGVGNTAVGFNALYRDTTGSSNTAIGNTALYSNTQQPNASIEVLSTWVYPRGATNYTTAQGISNDGNVAGYFGALHHLENGYIVNSRGKFTATFTVSPRARTLVQEINSSGLVTGYFVDGSEYHGFFYQDGAVTPYDVPGANMTIIFGLNDAGDFTGLYSTDGGTTSFASLGGTITDLSVPGSNFSWFWAINNLSQMVGYYSQSGIIGTQGFFRKPNGTYVTGLAFPGADTTQLFGLNDRGTIVGVWYDPTTSRPHGLILQSLNQYTQIDISGAILTVLSGINNNNFVTGYYTMPDQQTFGFLARLTP